MFYSQFSENDSINITRKGGQGDGTTDRIAITKKYYPLFQNYNSTVLKSQAYYLDIYYSPLISRLLIFLRLENFYWVESRERRGAWSGGGGVVVEATTRGVIFIGGERVLFFAKGKATSS